MQAAASVTGCPFQRWLQHYLILPCCVQWSCAGLRQEVEPDSLYNLGWLVVTLTNQVWWRGRPSGISEPHLWWLLYVTEFWGNLMHSRNKGNT